MAADSVRLEMLADLRKLLEAIDRRLPRLAHPDEAGIAAEAAELRARTAKLIADLEALESKNTLR